MVAFSQRSILFRPPCVNHHRAIPKEMTRTQLIGGGILYSPKNPSEHKILWCHGNAEDVGRLYHTIKSHDSINIDINSIHFLEYPGYGEAKESPISVEASLASIDDALNQNRWNVIVGFSLGGILTAEALNRRPEGTFTGRLILLNSSPNLTEVIKALFGSFVAKMNLLGLGNEGLFLPNRTVIVHSIDDYVIPYQIAEETANVLTCHWLRYRMVATVMDRGIISTFGKITFTNLTSISF